MTKHASKSSHLQLVDLPETVAVQVPLPVLGALANAENAFFELCVDVGQQVFSVLMEQDRESLCGAKGKHDPERRAHRGGSTPSDITLGGRRIPVRRLRARSRDGEELALPSFAFATDRDPLDRRTMEAIACGVSTRKYGRSLEQLREDQEERSTSKSAVSRRFVALSRKQMTAWLSMPLNDLDLRVLVIDGVVFHDHTVLIVLGIDSDGKKHVLGLREGTTENSRVAKALLRDLLERGLDPERARVFVIDGSKALHSAIKTVYGSTMPIQRCHNHKERNVRDHLPKDQQAQVNSAMKAAWKLPADEGIKKLNGLAKWLERDHPSAAGSLREGLKEMFTINRLNLSPTLRRSLGTTNIIESSFSGTTGKTGRVTRWRNGAMVVRWAATALLETEKHYKKIMGYRDLWQLQAHLHELDVEKNLVKERKVG